MLIVKNCSVLVTKIGCPGIGLASRAELIEKYRDAGSFAKATFGTDTLGDKRVEGILHIVGIPMYDQGEFIFLR